MRIRVLAYVDVLLLTASETLLTSRLFNGRDHPIRILPTALVAIVSHLQSKHQNNKRPTRFQIKSHQSNQKCLLSPKPTQATVLLPAHLSTKSQSTFVRIAPRSRTILHLNASKRKEAEAAARDLRRVQAHLERYRQVLDGHAATESDITQPLLKAARAAIKSYNCIPHPGDRARRTYMSAKRDFDETTRLMANDLKRLLQKIQAQNFAQAVHDGQ